MKNPNLLTVLMIITLLLSAASLSIVAAQNDQSILRFKDYSDQIQPQIPDNSTLSQDGDEVLYASDDGTQPQRDPLPDVLGAEDANLSSCDCIISYRRCLSSLRVLHQVLQEQEIVLFFCKLLACNNHIFLIVILWESIFIITLRLEVTC